MTTDRFFTMLTPLREMSENHLDDCISFLALRGSLRTAKPAERRDADDRLLELLKALFAEKDRRRPRSWKRILETKQS